MFQALALHQSDGMDGWMDGWVHKGAWPKDSYTSSHPQVSIMAWSKLEELLLKHLESFVFQVVAMRAVFSIQRSSMLQSC